jgi:esterase/lipase
MVLVLHTVPIQAASAVQRLQLQPSGVNQHFDFVGTDFPAYRNQIKVMIEDARLDINDSNRQDIINGNLPFELLPADSCNTDQAAPRRGILLIHGLSDSPYSLRYLGKYLQQQCLYVVSILLPGHGTRPGDLLDVQWQDWIKAVDFGIERVKDKADEVWLAGYSLGATLALHQTQVRGDIDGLILVSPALQLPTKAAFAWIRQWLGRFDKTALWWHIRNDNDPYKYESFPVNAITQLYDLIQSIQKTLDKPPALPLLIAASEDDATVDSRATIDLFKRWPATHKQLIWFSREMKPQEGTVEIIDTRVTDKHIASSSHINLLMPADDPHYGANGDYTACDHYFDEQPEAWQQCQALKEDLLAETTPYFLSQGIVRRISYNPYFDQLMTAIGTFLQR